MTAFDNAGCGLQSGNAVDNKTGLPSPTCTSKKSDYDSKAKLAIGGFVAGGVLVATGLVLWLTEPSAHASETASLSCLPALTTRGELGVGCHLRF